MTTPRQSPQDKAFINRMLDATIRIGMVLLLAYWCLKIISPFISPIMWAIIIAVAIYPLYVKLVAVMGGRKKMAPINNIALKVIYFLMVLISSRYYLIVSSATFYHIPLIRFRASLTIISPAPFASLVAEVGS